MSSVPPPEPAASLPSSTTTDAAAPRAYTLRDRWADYKTLVKPSITRMVVITTAIGFALAVRSGHSWTWLMLIGTLGGTALSCMAASVYNQAYEHRTDAMMPRTAKRPLAAKRLPMGEALALGTSLMLAGQAMLCMFGTPLASGVAAFTILSYALIYTPLKRVSPISLYVGAVPGALPPVIGYAAVTGSLFTPDAAAAWIIFLIMALWQVPHFLAIGYMYRKDYAAADLAMHAVRDPSGRSSFRNSILTCLVLLPAGLAPTFLGFAGWISFSVALLSGLVFLGLSIQWAMRPGLTSARRVFFASLIYLPVVLAVIMIDAR
ncbi:heme o synthase [Algisphaera agarilytica]|uniref:Protoheme IX farnesyltransferase n=1 Tax=Algisphaera agarilytica TaxID=1385975 RepID=A0A7X0HAL5_9BACT|nr:heme o synthase [Algisphaera agarilytica]MBB6430869.1 protoheme IX farnesyltransferase [Algisphaera agarilytica]